MWIFTEDGFVSVVAYNATKDLNKTGKHYKHVTSLPEDKQGDWLLIRGRVKEDIERVETVSGVDLMIDTDPKADYAYRGLMRKTDFGLYMAHAIDSIDYGAHFKEVVRDRAPKAEGRYSAMLSMWSSLAGIQDLPPYGGFAGSYTSGSSGSYTSGSSGSYTSGSSGSYTSGSASTTVTGGGYPWDRGKTGTVTTYKNGVSTTTYKKTPTLYTETVVLSDTYYELSAMVELLQSVVADSVDDEVLDNATDDAFMLWLEVKSRESNEPMTHEALQEIVETLGLSDGEN